MEYLPPRQLAPSALHALVNRPTQLICISDIQTNAKDIAGLNLYFFYICNVQRVFYNYCAVCFIWYQWNVQTTVVVSCVVLSCCLVLSCVKLSCVVLSWIRGVRVQRCVGYLRRYLDPSPSACNDAQQRTILLLKCLKTNIMNIVKNSTISFDCNAAKLIFFQHRTTIHHWLPQSLKENQYLNFLQTLWKAVMFQIDFSEFFLQYGGFKTILSLHSVQNTYNCVWFFAKTHPESHQTTKFQSQN